ncbi:MAG: UDP-2,3-diacylglucosamine diphosphatase [Limimaricola sp.]|nr:UDP-2,3-diacylglucosamine diphosphatase [Limimaricola sp.]
MDSPYEGGRNLTPQQAGGHDLATARTSHPHTMLPRVTRDVPAPARRHYRSLFLSDFHLGSKGCQAVELAEFLRHHSADHLYLVGDVFDTWRPMGPNWTPEHDAVVRQLMDIQQSGTQVTYLPGNHDALFMRFQGRHFDAVTIAQQCIHEAADGRRYLVIHGDSCDVFARTVPWLANVGAWMESLLREVNKQVNRGLKRLGWRRWDGIEELVNVVNGMLRASDRFEERLSALAVAQGLDGIVCGHFHQPALHARFGVAYANCGDWVENRSAIAEEADGTLRLLDWSDRRPVPGTPEAGQQDEDGLALAN